MTDSDTTDPGVAVPLGRDHPEIRDSVAAICAKYPGDYWRRLEDEGGYPDAFVAEMTEAGFMAALIPEEYGGAGLPIGAGAAILEEMHASGCDAYACHAQMYMMAVLVRHGSEEQRARYLPRIASGELRFQAFGVTEPSTGTDTLNLKTRAVRDGDHYVVNGQKIWTSRAQHSDLMTLLCRTTPADKVEKRTDGLSVLLVDINESLGNGLSIQPIDTMVNHHTAEVFYDNLRVPAENLIGEEGKGFRHILSGMNAERILAASESLGDCRYFIRRATEYAKERIVFGRPIGQNQGIQFPIARAYANYRAAEMMVRTAATLFEAGAPCGEEANLAKHLASEAGWEAAEAAMQTFGGFAASREYDLERKWKSARLTRIAPVSTNLILAYIGQHVLGLPRSY